MATLGSCDAIPGGIPQVNPKYTQTVPATDQSLSFNSPCVHFSFSHPNLQVSYQVGLQLHFKNQQNVLYSHKPWEFLQDISPS